MALRAGESGLLAVAPDHPNVMGLVVDIPAERGFATVVALADNTTSMYTSVGGGTVGAGQHTAVADATQALLRTVEAHLSLFPSEDDASFPGPGQVRFHVLGLSGRRRAEVPDDAFWGRQPDRLIQVISATQDVITKMRSHIPT
jgi:hypothetical protein